MIIACQGSVVTPLRWLASCGVAGEMREHPGGVLATPHDGLACGGHRPHARVGRGATSECGWLNLGLRTGRVLNGEEAMYLVIRERLRHDALSEPEGFREFQKRYDAWMRQHGARYTDVRHYQTVVGHPILETWLTYPDYATLEADRTNLSSLEGDPAWQQMNLELHRYLERIESQIVEELDHAPPEL